MLTDIVILKSLIGEFKGEIKKRKEIKKMGHQLK